MINRITRVPITRRQILEDRREKLWQALISKAGVLCDSLDEAGIRALAVAANLDPDSLEPRNVN